jgi:glutamate racemase
VIEILSRWRRRTFVVILACAVGCAGSTADGPTTWLEKDEITIAVTDSGLGGISVVADLEKRLREARAFKSVDIVFFNALFSNESGYNSLASRDEKTRYFDLALASLARRYEPDLVLVACNTLSVLLHETAFVRRGRIPVRNVVEPGVALIEESLRDSPQGRVVLFATRTTVEEDSHRKALAEDGFDPGRVVTQECPELAGTIERGFDSEDTELLIEIYVDEAVEKLGKPSGPVFVSLNCTHYPYAEPLWRAAFDEYDLGPVSVLNPNQAMVDALVTPQLRARFERTEIEVTVVSKVEISEERRLSIGRAVRPVSGRTADALLAYEWQPELF